MLRAILFILLLGATYSYAQTIPLRRFTDEDGLISNTIYCIAKDHNGYMWFTSDKGICRFNGLEFRNFTTADGLPDNEVFNVREDEEGRLWLCCFNGYMCFYKDGKFFTASNTPWLKLPFKSPVLRSFNQRDGSIIFIFHDLSNFAEVHHDRLSIYPVPLKKPIFSGNGTLLTIKKNAPGNYTLLYPYGTVTIDTTGKVLGRNEYNPQKQFHYLTSYATGVKDEYYLSDDGLYDTLHQLLFPIKTKLNLSYSVGTKVLNGNYFIGLLNGLLINDSIKIGSDSHVSFIENDLAGNIWFSTIGNGIYSLSSQFASMRTYQNIYDGRVLHAKVKNGNVLFATNYGSLFEIRERKFRSIYQNKNYAPADKNFLTAANFLINDSMDYILLDGENALIIPHADRGLTQKKSFPFPIQATIKELFHDNGKLFVGSVYALEYFDYEAMIRNAEIKGTKFAIRKLPGDNRIYGRDINPYNHEIWFSQSKKLYELKNNLQIEKSAFKGITLRQFELLRYYLIGLSEDNKLIIANSTNDDVPIAEVIYKNCIWSHIYPIDDAHAIISTNNYYRLLTLLPPSADNKPHYTIQTIEDPFIPLRAEYVAADNNKCYFFKNGSVTEIKMSLLFKNTPAPAVVFAQFRTKNETYPIRPEIDISYNEAQSISITFDNLSYSGKDITSQYSLSENGKDDWRQIEGNEINLNKPGHGTFTIKVRSQTLSGGYSKPAVLVLNVQKPFWATWWFISLAAIVFILLVWAIILLITWRRLRKKQKEHDADMKYQQSEYKALNALMNPHFIFNSLNNIQGLINKDEKRTANQYLVIFSDLVRQNMHNISKGFISLQEELTLIENYLTLEKLRFKELVNYSINIEEDIDIDDILIPPLMIQPLVENAVKHGLLPKQSALSIVIIHVYEKEDILYVIIEDNGIGLTESLKSQNRLHDSFGLSNLQKRTEHLKKIQQHEISIEVAEIKDMNGTVTGTRAVVTIQLN